MELTDLFKDLFLAFWLSFIEIEQFCGLRIFCEECFTFILLAWFVSLSKTNEFLICMECKCEQNISDVLWFRVKVLWKVLSKTNESLMHMECICEKHIRCAVIPCEGAFEGYIRLYINSKLKDSFLKLV